ncbi:MAG TPA: S24/S26 family peptidase [Chitinispirillaceae bacterium]|nr:S24/S26 family peptidase [Chitinispirillaceae bacterium]
MNQSNPFDLISDLLFKNDIAEIPVQGSCMAPVFTDGEKVVVKPVRYPLREGNIYIFVYCNNLYVHRLFKLKNGIAQFTGDRSRTCETVPAQAIIGEPATQNSSLSKCLILLINSTTFIHRGKAPYFLKRLRICAIISILKIERWLYERKI